MMVKEDSKVEEKNHLEAIQESVVEVVLSLEKMVKSLILREELLNNRLAVAAELLRKVQNPAVKASLARSLNLSRPLEITRLPANAANRLSLLTKVRSLILLRNLRLLRTRR